MRADANFTNRKPQSRWSPELWARGQVAVSTVLSWRRSQEARRRGDPTVFLLCSLTARLSAISERFSSSSLPPSFAQRRRTTVFLAGGAATAGAPARIRRQHAAQA